MVDVRRTRVMLGLHVGTITRTETVAMCVWAQHHFSSKYERRNKSRLIINKWCNVK